MYYEKQEVLESISWDDPLVYLRLPVSLTKGPTNDIDLESSFEEEKILTPVANGDEAEYIYF